MFIRSLAKRFGILVVMPAALFGCGGAGGGGSSSSAGGANASFSGQFTVTGGNLVASTTAGATQTVQVTDSQGNTFTFPSVFSPDTLNILNTGQVTIIKAGSKLFAGHYTSQTATYIDTGDGITTPVPLTSTGAIAHDMVVSINGEIQLPIDTVGSFSFPNGIQIGLSTLFNVVQNATISASGSATLSPSGSAGTDVSTTLTFNGGGSPLGTFQFMFQGTGEAYTFQAVGSSPFTTGGATLGNSTSFPTATVTYTYSN